MGSGVWRRNKLRMDKVLGERKVIRYSKWNRGIYEHNICNYANANYCICSEML